MKRLLLFVFLIMPHFVNAQKIDEQALKTQLIKLCKSSLKDYKDLKGSVKSITGFDTLFNSKFKFIYSSDTNYMVGGIYSISIDVNKLHISKDELVAALTKIITTTDLGYGKMESNVRTDGVHTFVYQSKTGKQVGDQTYNLTIEIKSFYTVDIAIQKEDF